MKKKIHITLERDNGNVAIKIKLPKELEEFFKTMSGNKTATSTYWKNDDGVGQSFYVIKPQYQETINKTLNGTSSRSQYFDNYGNGLVQSGNYSAQYNIAPLRTVGASSGYITLKSDRFENVSNLELEQYIQELGRAVKKIWETLINKTKIKSVITFEI